MNPIDFFLHRFGVKPSTPLTYVEAVKECESNKPQPRDVLQIVRDSCPMDYFHLSLETRNHLTGNCMNISCADCWESKYKGEKPR